MWDTAFNFLKILGSVGGLAALVVIVARVWNGTANERLIKVLESELKLKQEHCEGADRTVLHYRDEMHDTRKECEGKTKVAELERDQAKDALKQVQIENADLRARTDLSPVMMTMTEFIKEHRESMEQQREFIREQTEINTQILSVLKGLSKTT